MTGPPVLLLHGFGTSYAETWVANGWADLLTEAGRTSGDDRGTPL